MVEIGSLVPQNHLLRKIDAAVDFNRLYDMVEPLYCEDDARYTPEYKDLYRRRKETIERVFADAKEKHAMRYTRYRGLAQTAKWVKLSTAETSENHQAAREYRRQYQ